MSDKQSMTMEEAIAHNAAAGGSRWIEYEGLRIMAPLRDIEEAIAALNKGNRANIMASVTDSLARNLPYVQDGSAPLEQAMLCGQDIAIWFANEVIEGRATLVQH